MHTRLQLTTRVVSQRIPAIGTIGLIVSLALLSAGCGATLMPAPNLLIGVAPGPFEGVPAALQTPYAEVLYLTDRARSEPGAGRARYGYERSPSLAYGTARVKWDAIDSWPQLCEASCKTPRLMRLTTRLDDVTELGRMPETPWKAQPTPAGLMEALPEVRQEYEQDVAELQRLVAERLALTPRKEAYVFIHGFNNGFDEAIPVIAELWHFVGRIGVPIAYTWPAGKGFNLRGYNYDRESGEFTVFHLKQFLEALAATPGLERINLIAHSRGTDVLCSALRELNIKYRARFPDEPEPAARVLRIDHVVLAAPDMDVSVARQRLEAERLGRVCNHLTMYSSPDDLAIGFAKWLFESTIRLGTLGFMSLPAEQRTALSEVAGVEFIDARVSKDLVGHSYFYSNPAVSSDLILLLRDNKHAGAEHGRPLKHVRGSFWELYDGYPAK